ncbi:MAG: nucleotidyltransferase [Desulfurococcaceae archaeon]
MKYTKSDLARIFRALEKKGVTGVIIGDTSVQLYLGASELEGDIDVFVIEPSPLAYREVYEEVAVENNWELSTSEAGLPALVVPVREGYVVVEFYENYMDIEVPLEFFEEAYEYKVDGTIIKAVRPEHYLVLKARQGTDLDKLEKYAASLKQKGLNLKLVERAASVYPPEESRIIIERLRSIKLSI